MECSKLLYNMKMFDNWYSNETCLTDHPWKQLVIEIEIQEHFVKTTYYSTLQVYQRSNSQVRHIPPKMSDKFESQYSLSPTIWSDILVGRWRESV
jgi:hypothetical protein